MQHTLAALLFFTLFFSQTVCLAAAKLLVVTDPWPPYVFLENGNATGFDYEVMQAVLAEMGYEIDFKLLPWKRCIQMIKVKKADAILDVSENEEREKFMFFPEEQLSESSSVLFHRKGERFTFNSLDDLEGLTIGTILGYKYNREFLEAETFTREPVKNEEQNFQKLLLGRIDLLLANRNVGLYTAKKMGILDEVDYLPKPLSGGNNYLAFGQKPGYEKLAQRFSDYLAAFKKTEAYHAILQRYGQ